MTGRAGLLALALLAVPIGPTSVPLGSPHRVILSSRALTHIVGGLGAAAVSVTFPDSFVTATNGSLGWNIAGNRCQYTCSSFAPTDIGFNISMQAVTNNGVSAPSLLIESDGNTIAIGGSKLVASNLNGFSYYTGQVLTQCVGGSNAGNFCTRNLDCTAGGGSCRTCDLSTSPATCNAPPNVQGPCQVPNLTEEACYLKANCATGSGGGCTGEIPEDCSSTGAGSSAGSSGPFHSAIGAVTVTSGGSTFTVGASEHIYQVVKVTNQDQTKCQGLPDGGN